GFEVRVELALADGERLWAQVTRDEAEQLALERGLILYVRPHRTRVFDQEAARDLIRKFVNSYGSAWSGRCTSRSADSPRSALGPRIPAVAAPRRVLVPLPGAEVPAPLPP